MLDGASGSSETLYRLNVYAMFWTPYMGMFMILTALHKMKTRYSDEKAVCLSVCLSARLSNA